MLIPHAAAGRADHVRRGSAGRDEFRTAPLWGLGQRIFFLHDGRSGPANGGLVHAIEQHASSGSEANTVISNFNQVATPQKQKILNYLRAHSNFGMAASADNTRSRLPFVCHAT